MKVILKKPHLHMDAMYPAGSVIEVDENKGKWICEMPIADKAPADAKLTGFIDPPITERKEASVAKEMGEAMGKALKGALKSA
jgi:hypothetical protein